MSCTKPYINVPMRKAESVVPTIAKVKIVPKFLKKYFWGERQKSNYGNFMVDL